MGWFFDTSGFTTHSANAIGWTMTLRTIYALANFTVAASFLAIPVALGVLYHRKHRELMDPWMYPLFAGTLVLCALTYIHTVISFWWAPWRLYTLLSVLTALASVAAACTLPFVVHKLVRMPSHAHVHHLNKQLTDLAAERAAALRTRTAERDELLTQLAEAREAIAGRAWAQDAHALLDRLDAAAALLKAKPGA